MGDDDKRGDSVFVDFPLRVDKSMGAGMGEVSSTPAISLTLSPIAEMEDNDEEGEAVFVDFPLCVDKSMGAGEGKISTALAPAWIEGVESVRRRRSSYLGNESNS